MAGQKGVASQQAQPTKTSPKPPTHEEAAHESARKAHAALAAAHSESQHAKDAADDVNFAKAKEHAANAAKHHADVERHSNDAAAHAQKHGGDLPRKIDEHLRTHDDQRPLVESSARAHRSAEAHIQFAEGDQKTVYSRRVAPENGALTTSEYRNMSESYARSVTPEQRVAIQNYSDHSDHILNPMLRASGGRVDQSMNMYSGPHVSDEVHRGRAEKALAHREGRNLGYLDPAEARPVHESLAGRKVSHEVADLDSAIAAHRTDRDVKVYRVLSDQGGKITGSLGAGSVLQDHAYVSTTADVNALNKFYSGPPEHRVDFHITVKSGHQVAPISTMSSFKQEREMLLPRGSKFRITKIEPATRDAPKRIYAETIH